MTPTQRTLAHLRKDGLVHGVCQLCGSAFVKAQRGKPYKFCSRACAVRGRSGPSRRDRVGKYCAFCGQYYEVQRKSLETSKYCCRDCKMNAIDHRGAKNPNCKNAGVRRCEGCGREYKSYNNARRFCSEECAWDNAKEETVRNGRRGYDAELRCCAELTSRGYSAYRSAASRGPFDVFALGFNGAVCVQVKRTKDRARRRHPQAVKEITQIGAPVTPHNRKQMWCWVDREGWFVVDVQPDGTTREGWGLDWLDLQPVQQGELNVMRDSA